MGIPHLIATLEPYAEHGVLRGEQVVIDGPALAYHILHVCRAHGISQPSYHVLGEAVIRWLDELEKSGSTIQHIYFDGTLPSSKQHVRMERMMKSSARIDDFFDSNPKGCPIPRLEKGEGEVVPAFDVFETANPGTRPPPDPGFMVPAILEVIHQSNSYGRRSSVVPGEADAFCARHVAQHGGTVMTSDSDLLAHDLGHGKVVFLREIHRTAEGELSCLIFNPREIYANIGLPASAEPWRFAYERKHSPNASLSRLVSACFLPVADAVGYDEFRQQYLSCEDAVAAIPLDKRSCCRPKLRLGCLDPRVSELIIQLGHNAADPSIFLPTIIENPLRGTAWEPSMPTRRLAYSIASWLMDSPPSPTVYEFRRVRQRSQRGRQLSLIPRGAMAAAINGMISLLRGLRRFFPGDIGHRHWITLSILLDVVGCEEQGKTSHLLETLRKGYTPSPKSGSRMPWDIAHFVAQIQAGLYSLRILVQVLNLVTKEAGFAFSGRLGLLKVFFWQFPSLPRFPDTLKILETLEPAAREQALKIIGSLASPGEDPLDSKVSDEAHQVGKQGGPGENSSTGTRPSPTGRSTFMNQNKFGVLDIDQ